MRSYLVGGAVRDALLGRNGGDRDFVVVGATPEQMTAAGFRPVLAEGIKRCGATVTRVCVVDQLNKLQNFSTNGLTGPISLNNPKGQAVLPIKLFQTDPANATVKSLTDFVAY